jgi:CRISPR-associated protein Csd1
MTCCFRFYADSGFIHDRPAARTAVEGAPGLTQGGDRAQCLVTGEIGSVVRLHSLVRGVPGTLPTGAALVSFNLPSSFSYGKSQGEIAPVSSQAALAYSAALADLLASTKALDGSDEARWSNRAQLGDTTVLFWADADDRAVGDEAEAVVAALLGLPDGVPGSGPSALMAAQAALRDFHAALPDGLAGGGRPARFHILGLRPNVARLSVRFWFENSLGEIATSFEELWGDLRLEPAPARLAPSIRDLLLELAPLRRAESIPTHLSGALMRSILSGAPFPKTLLVQALMRVRAERSTTPLRTALIKACLARDARQGLSDEGVPVSLSRDEPNVGYRLGRLFAVLDAAQRAGVGRVNLRLADKFFGSASVTPARVFPLLLKGARIHLTAAKRHGSAGRAVVLDQEISRILAGLPADAPFPPILRLADQGRFVVGFYHETAEIWTRGAFGRLTDQPGAQDVTA